MVFSRNTHKLPKFPPQVIPAFKALCESVPASSIPGMLAELNERVQQMLGPRPKGSFLDPKLVSALHSRCQFLFERYSEFSAKQQALIVGAVRYFALADDGSSDDAFATGLDDDIKVINYVLEQLGIEGLFIEIDHV